VLITGIAGFTGGYLRRELEALGHTVIGLSHEAPSSVHDHQVDLTNALSVASCVRDAAPDDVVHLGAISFVAHEHVERLYQTNAIGTLHLLSALAGLSRPPRRVILASSANIYGDVIADAVDETFPAAPVNHYAASKVAMEAVAAAFRTELSITIARPFNYTGPGQDTKFLVPKLVDHFARRAPRIELGNLEVERDFLDVRTVAQIYGRLLDTDEAKGQVVNLCSGRGICLRDLVKTLERITGHAMTVEVNPAFVRKNEIRRLVGSNRRLHELVGDIPELLFDQTLRDMLEASSSSISATSLSPA
jgi:nucleoside-diphosphate-sugar epimerase